MTEAVRIPRAYNPKELLQKRVEVFEGLPSEWEALLGRQRRSGVWFAWGNSGNGKTEFVLQLLAMLSTYDTCLYLSLEEGLDNLHLHEAIRRNGLEESKTLLLSFDSIEELHARLEKQRSPNVVLIDTVQYWGITYEQYRALKDAYPRKLIIILSHVSNDGRNPDGSVAQKIKRDSDLRLWIEGFRAHNKGRSLGTSNVYSIWDEGAANYWGDDELTKEIE